MLEDGTLLRTKKLNNPNFTAGGNGGGVQRFDWNGNLLWEYEVSSTLECQHHDVEYLPNGNVLMVVWESMSQAEAIQAGRNPNTAPSALWPDKIIEVEPNGLSGGNIVWEWHAKDHLIQDMDPTKDNFGVVAEHPELIDINYPNSTNSDWLHINSVDFNAEFDQIVVSVHNTHELWIIDHSTTIQEAAGHTGGNSGKGGDLLYRWGNPEAYDSGNQSNKMFYAQHDARWITQGSDIGKLMVYNNGQNQSRPYSSVDIIDPPVDAFGNYTIPTAGDIFLPNDIYWTYEADPNEDFYSSNISGAHRLPNDNTIICEGANGRLFEVETDGTIVWEYQSPVGNSGPLQQGINVEASSSVFRCTRYSADYDGFIGKDLTPGDVIELNSNTDCTLFDNALGIEQIEKTGLQVIQNTNAKYLSVMDIPAGSTISVLDSQGRLVVSKSPTGDRESFNTGLWPSGIYILNVSSEEHTESMKVMVF
jgi:hypothetical protein